MNEILSNPLVIAAAIPAIVSLIIVFWNHQHHKRNSDHKGIVETLKKITEDLKTIEDKKRNIDDCQRFRTRIGKESDEHEKKITTIEKACVFLVTKAGGDPSDLGII